MKNNLKTAIFSTFLVLFAGAAFAADIQWKVYFNNNLLASQNLPETSELVISSSELSNLPSGTQSIASAIDGMRLSMQQPVNRNIEIRVIFNVLGDGFSRAGNITPFMNMTLRCYMNGIEQIDFDYPILVVIPGGAGLNSLLSKAGVPAYSAICTYYLNGTFVKTGIVSSYNNSEFTARMTRFGQIIGATGDALGYPSSISNVQYDTWSKIKILFR
jgi:hypothetical protein